MGIRLFDPNRTDFDLVFETTLLRLDVVCLRDRRLDDLDRRLDVLCFCDRRLDVLCLRDRRDWCRTLGINFFFEIFFQEAAKLERPISPGVSSSRNDFVLPSS